MFKLAPKKPNSAKRSVARVLLSNKRKTIVYIPGVGHNLQKHSTLLIRGGRAQDLPGVNFRAIRGKFDLDRIYGRGKSRLSMAARFDCKRNKQFQKDYIILKNKKAFIKRK